MLLLCSDVQPQLNSIIGTATAADLCEVSPPEAQVDIGSDDQYPNQIALDSNDNVYVTDPDNHRVFKYGNDGKLLAVLGKPGTDLSSFNEPTGIALDAADKRAEARPLCEKTLQMAEVTQDQATAGTARARLQAKP